ncbi:bifunctional adenosylcobinamide kinase/adenosylcobinamide-phosphate guanylyltransferase [Bacillaceae bacterium Marseille-Q3522]|nr:bifunctional adenosylcobinamide kinase/adenosylcobinamide-phosphate guanylyltransferase [Bacillaceae bacterium Marseille-Q3522]
MGENGLLVFITGGVRSGKSSFAEKTALEMSRKTGGNLHYIAAGQASDSEMKQRIARHQEERRRSGHRWTTWEKPVTIGMLARNFHQHDIVLLDCLTTWLNNELFFVKVDWLDENFQKELLAKMLNGINDIRQKAQMLLIVSNEVAYEPLANDSALVKIYMRLLGKLHQNIVFSADNVFLLEAGIPVSMKRAED